MDENYYNIIIACEDIYGLDVYMMIQAINISNSNRKKYNVLGFISDVPKPFGTITSPKPILDTISGHQCVTGAVYALAIRDPRRKEKAVILLKPKAAQFETLIAPWTLLPSNYTVGDGCIIGNYCLKNHSVIGNFVIMDSVMCETIAVGDYSTICPFVNTTNAIIGNRVYIGSHAVLMKHITIGDDAVIYPGSVVLTNVKPGSEISGVPAKRVKNHLI